MVKASKKIEKRMMRYFRESMKIFTWIQVKNKHSTGMKKRKIDTMRKVKIETKNKDMQEKVVHWREKKIMKRPKKTLKDKNLKTVAFATCTGCARVARWRRDAVSPVSRYRQVRSTPPSAACSNR